MEFGLSRLSASPVVGKLYSEPVELSPLNLGDWGYIEQYMRQLIISAAAEASKGLPDAQARIIMREATREAAATSVTSGDARNGMFSSMPTLLRVAYLSLKKTQKSLTVESVEKLFGSDFETLSQVCETIFAISFPGFASPKNQKPGQEETKA